MKSEEKYLNIVALIDGTQNEYKKGTNLAKLEASLYSDKKYILPEASAEYLTVVSHRPGPGTDPRTVCRGSIWAGDLAKAIGATYEWIAVKLKDNATAIKNQRCPRISLFGFSRGAYSVHVLSWILRQVGVPRKVDLAREIVNAYCDKDRNKWQRLRKEAECYSSPRIAMMGCWDIVTSLLDTMSEYHDGVLSPLVDVVYHAMAANERRKFYPVMQYRNAGSDRVKQFWFSGVHGDVGRTYSDDTTLSDISYAWIASMARMHGLGFRKGYEPNPQTEYEFSKLKKHDQAWTDAPNRRFHRGEKLHSSLIARLKGDSSYAMDVLDVPARLISRVKSMLTV